MATCLFLLAGLALVTTTIWVVVALRERADGSQRAHVVVVRVEALANQLQGTPWRATSATGGSPEFAARELRDLDRTVRASLGQLERAGTETADLRSLYDRYVGLVRLQTRLVEDDRHGDAVIAGGLNVGPARIILLDALDHRADELDAAARRASLTANVGSGAMVFLFFLVSASVFVLLNRARTAAEKSHDALDDQNTELRELDGLKDEFIALVSHELRTPLTSIRGYLELVTDGPGELDDEQQQFLGVVVRNAERLQSLVGDLLFVAQIEAGRLHLETGPVELEQVAADAVESARPYADEKGIQLTLRAEPLPALEGDRGRLGQLLDNFLSNAIKFTPTGGSVQVRVGEHEGSIRIEIEDTGMGIPKAEQARLFERFFRTSSATAEAIQGTGLGLTISKGIAEAHGGSITFTSVENEGTTFRITLPLAASTAGRRRPVAVAA